MTRPKHHDDEPFEDEEIDFDETDSEFDNVAFDRIKYSDQQTNIALKKFHERSKRLHDAELELAEHLLHSLQPYKSIYQNTMKHTAFRSAICSLFADREDVDLLRYENQYE